MSSLVVVGPLVTLSGPTHDKFSFRYPKLNPLVSKMYRIAGRVGRESGLDVWFPRDTAGKKGNKDWLDEATDRINAATAVFAVFVGDSQAIPAEARLASAAGVPLLIAAIDYFFIEDFKKDGVPIIDAESGPSAIEEQLANLLGGTASES